MAGQGFDPLLIVYQIVCLQCFYYLAFGSLLGVCHAVFDISVSLDHFFTPKYVNFVTFVGWLEVFCILIAGVLGAYLLSIIVEKSKKCVDFTFTLTFIHFVITTCRYEQIPLEWEWWVVYVVASVLMASLGEYVCARSELEDIPLYTPTKT